MFWIVATALVMGAGAWLAAAMLRGGDASLPAAAYDLQVYRDQLREVDRDVARGVLGEDDAARVRTEVSRRILAADAQMQAAAGGAQAQGGSGLAAAVVVALLAAGSGALYWHLGAPGYRDLPLEARIAASDEARADRLTQSEAEAQAGPLITEAPANQEFLAIIEQLRQTVAARPNDLKGLTFLMQNEARLGNMQAAMDAQRRIIEVKGEGAAAGDYAMLADLMVNAAKGYVSSDAENAIKSALQRDPNDPLARYYMGQYLLQVDRPDGAFRTLSQLLVDSRPDAPWVPALRAQLEDVAWRAGVQNYTLPPENTPEVTAQDIEAMVAGLAERLAAEGGSVDEWAQLINAQAVLGRVDTALLAWNDARAAFAGDEAALAQLEAAAKAAGIAE